MLMLLRETASQCVQPSLHHQTCRNNLWHIHLTGWHDGTSWLLWVAMGAALWGKPAEPTLSSKVEQRAALTWSWGRHLGALQRWRWPPGRCVDWSSSLRRTPPQSQRNLIYNTRTTLPPLYMHSRFVFLNKNYQQWMFEQTEMWISVDWWETNRISDRDLKFGLHHSCWTYFTEPLIFVWSSSWNLYW